MRDKWRKYDPQDLLLDPITWLICGINHGKKASMVQCLQSNNIDVIFLHRQCSLHLVILKLLLINKNSIFKSQKTRFFFFFFFWKKWDWYRLNWSNVYFLSYTIQDKKKSLSLSIYIYIYIFFFLIKFWVCFNYYFIKWNYYS